MLMHRGGQIVSITTSAIDRQSVHIKIDVSTINLTKFNFDVIIPCMIDIEKIRKLREKLDLTHEAAAAKAGLSSRQAWHNIESGRQPNLQVNTLEAIAKALGVKAKDLLK